jgi:DNA-binding NarL/FixJ family response regulator
LIADDHPILRKGTRGLLETEPDIEVVDEAGDGPETLRKVRVHQPDVLLLDIVMPGLDGLEATEKVREISPKTKIVIHTLYDNRDYVHLALKAGALGYLLKSGPSEEIPAAIRAANAGRYFLNSFITSSVIDAYLKGRQEEPVGESFQGLSKRERQVFLLLVEGFSTSQIAEVLSISPKTVEKHRTHVAARLGIDNPIEMVKYAIRIGLIDPGVSKF